MSYRRIVDTYLGNPFTTTATERAAADVAIDTLDVLREIEARLDRGELVPAKQLLLSVGHAEALRWPDHPDRVLPLSLFPESLYARFPRARDAYLRIVVASGRCYRALSELAGRSTRMAAVRRHVWAACFGETLPHALELERLIRDHDVLILGETGTGKELVAHAMLEAIPGTVDSGPAPRSSVNAAAIPETLIESELFGHAKGAFTGATEARAGRIRSASGGALFLDEVGDLPLHTQVKLLRVIETNEVHPLGADRTHAVDVRYVAATHKDLDAMVEARRFRQDLYERLAGHVIRLPALRERPEDIPDIGRVFVRTHLKGYLLPGQRDRVEAWLESDAPRSYPWPGNVRELQNALRNLLLGLDPGLRTDLPAPAPAVAGVPSEIVSGAAPFDGVQRWYAEKVLALNEGNFAAASRALGVDRSTLRRWMKR